MTITQQFSHARRFYNPPGSSFIKWAGYHAGVSEWFKEAVLKTVGVRASGGSNPSTCVQSLVYKEDFKLKHWKRYVTICYRDNMKVEYLLNEQGIIESRFQTSITKGFKRLVLDEHGKVIKIKRFNPSEVDFCQRFLATNLPLIRRLLKNRKGDTYGNFG